MSQTQFYTVGFTIHDATNLVTKGGVPIDPLILVRCCGNEYKTDIKHQKTGVVAWEESKIWSNLTLTKQEWESSFIEFELQAANTFWRNDIVGSCSLQLSVVRGRRTHQISRTFPLLSTNETDTKGTLRITVYALAPGDNPPSPGDMDSEDEDERKIDDTLQKAVIDKDVVRDSSKVYHVYVSAHRVEDVSRSGTGAERNPYVTCEFAQSRLESTKANAATSHSFNECFRIPVTHAVSEDSILIKLFDAGFLGKHEMLAQGNLSFAELRAKPIAPRWYVFYGFDPSEVPDISSFMGGDSAGKPNLYKGRMMISARAERLDKPDQLLPAAVIAGRPLEEPAFSSLILQADVYEVVGIPADEITCEVSFGPLSERTEWQKATTNNQNVAVSAVSSILQTVGLTTQQTQGKVFEFNQKNGRVEKLQLSTPLEPRQQWDVILSVFAKVGARVQRIAYHRCPLSNIPTLREADPRTPVWIPLTPMPALSSVKFSAAMLVNLEKVRAEELIRGRRKFVASRDFELRCYIYAARFLQSFASIGGHLPDPICSASCAGVRRETSAHKDTANPLFMECLKLPIRLATDPINNMPTMAPVGIDIFERRSRGKILIGRATCHYDKVRTKPKPGEQSEALHPKWIQLHGGPDLNRRCGDILVCFELISQKTTQSVPSQPMRPDLKICSIYLSVLGLRNLIHSKQKEGVVENILAKARSDPAALIEKKEIKRPVILFSLPSYGSDGREKIELMVPWNPPQPSGAASSQTNRSWKLANSVKCFDLFTVVCLKAPLPEDPIYDPLLTIKVYDKKLKSRNFIGEFSYRLLPLLPWVNDVPTALESIEAREDFSKTVNVKMLGSALDIIKNQLKMKQKGRLQLGIMSLQEADRELLDEKIDVDNDDKNAIIAKTEEDESIFHKPWIAPSGVPILLIESYKSIFVLGIPVCPVTISMYSLNVFIPSGFVVTAEGSKILSKKNEEFVRPSVDGILEDYLDDIAFLRSDLQKKIFSSSVMKPIKCGEIRMAAGIEYKDEFRCEIDDEATYYAFDEKRFRKTYRDETSIPSAIRARIYVIRGIALSNPEGVSCNPYLWFNYGSRLESTRAIAKTNTVAPDFFVLQEADLSFPDEGSVVIQVWSKNELLGIDSDHFIGETSIDLEERWFSKEWKRMMKKKRVPLEYRPLKKSTSSDVVMGTLELWIEILTPSMALEYPRFDLKTAIETELELRLIVWGARNLSFRGLGKQFIDAMVTSSIECSKYAGEHSASQDTDVHYHSTSGSAVFNWRVVYPRIRLPVTNCVIQLAIWDYRAIGKSVFVGEVNIELRNYLEKVAQTLNSVEYDAEFKLTNRQSKHEFPGYVQVTVQIMYQAEANTKKAGLGRGDPNVEPRLTTPHEGRQWEDFLKAAGLRRDFTGLYNRLRWTVFGITTMILFIMLFVYPALLWQ